MRISKRFEFDAAHRLTKDPTSPCYNLHGHRYVCEISVAGFCGDLGMLIDFGVIKEKLIKPLMTWLDHGVILNSEDKSGLVEICLEQNWKNLLLADREPTVESISVFIKDKVELLLQKENLMSGSENTKDELGLLVYDVRIKLWETPTCYAETVD